MTTITLNVGGTHIETLKSTLIKIPYFKSLLERWHQDQKEIFLDVDSKIFKYVLNKIRNQNYEFPTNAVKLQNIISLLDYFSIDINHHEIEKKETPQFDHVYPVKGIELCDGNQQIYEIDTSHQEILYFIFKNETLEYFCISYQGYNIIRTNDETIHAYFEFERTEKQYRYWKLREKIAQHLSHLGRISVHIRGKTTFDCVCLKI
jgi:BTB/POZ domain